MIYNLLFFLPWLYWIYQLHKQGIPMKKEIYQLNVKLDNDSQKRNLQILANKNTDGNISALIKMLADGKDIKK